MDNFEENQPLMHEESQFEALLVTEDIRSYIYETAKWTNFLSIVGFILCALLVIFAFSVGAILNLSSAVTDMGTMGTIGSAGLTFVYLLMALLYFYPSLLLFKYSSAAKKAILYGDQLSLSNSMAKMKSFFKFWGILTIIMLAFYVIIFLFVIVAGIGASTLGA